MASASPPIAAAAALLAGVADAVAVVDRRVEGVGRGDRDALLEQLLDDVVIGADLRRRHDQAVDGRILHDLVEDLDLARDVVDRRFGAEHDRILAPIMLPATFAPT